MKNTGSEEPRVPTLPAPRSQVFSWRRGRWLALGLVGLIAFVFWLTRPLALPPGVSSEMAELVRQLRAQPSFLRSFAAKAVVRFSPRLAEQVSGRDAAERRRLAAYQSLIAAGTNLAPAAVMLVGALDDSAVEVRGFAFRVLANAGVPALAVARLARQGAEDSVVLAWLFAGLLRDECGPVREFAWSCLEAFTPEATAVRDNLADFAETMSNPSLHDRACRLLAAMPGLVGTEPVRAGVP